MEETISVFTQRELIDKALGMLESVANDFNQEQVTDFQEELEKIQASLCTSCGNSGTFFFTKDNNLDDSQPCGKCNKKSLDAVIEYAKLNESYLERVSTANKIISEKIYEIKKLTQKLDEIYPCSSGATSLSVIEVLYLHRFKVRMEDFLKTKYGLYVNNPNHTNEWKLLEEISDILNGVTS